MDAELGPPTATIAITAAAIHDPQIPTVADKAKPKSAIVSPNFCAVSIRF